MLVALGVATVLAPGPPVQAAGGTPLSPGGWVAAAAVMYAAIALPRPGWRSTGWLAIGLAVVVGLKLAGTAVAPPIGLKASYWAGAQPGSTPERSTDFAWLTDATRIEPRLDLRGEQFAVHFFNDASRFNFGPDVQPGRDQLPFTVRWQGWLLAPSDGERQYVVESTGPARVWLDDQEFSPGGGSVKTAAGLHSLRAEYSRLPTQVPRLRVSWQRQPGDALEPLGGADLRWQPSTASDTLSALLGLAAQVLFVGVLAVWIVRSLSAWRPPGREPLIRAGLGLVPLLFLGYGMLLLAPAVGQATILSGLDDWLVYESSARDILLNGLLMDGGQGHAAPFYGQPLYPYALALAHRLTGEGLVGPLALQFAALGGVLAATAVLARRAFGAFLDGLVALAGMALLLQLEPEHFKIARQLFNENLYMPLVMASLIVLVGLARRPAPPRWWQALLAGVLLGLTAIARSQFLLSVPFGLAILWLAWRRRRLDASWKALLILVGVGLAVLPVTARNLVVSGQLVPISSGAGASLLEFHRPPAGLIDQNALQTQPLFEVLHLDTPTRTVLAFAKADPRGYLATLLPLGAHSVGLQGRNDPGVYWPLLLTSLLYLASFGLRGVRQLHVWPIHVFVATHLLVLMLFEADTYGYRLVMPMYAPMVAVAAQVPLAAIRLVFRVGRRRASAEPEARRAMRYAQMGWGALLVAALVWQAASLVALWPDRETTFHGLGGAAAHAAATSDRVDAGAIYVASVDGTPRRFGSGNLPGLRYPWFKWFDPARSLPLPAPETVAVYMLSELAGSQSAGDLTECLGPADTASEVVIHGADARQQCAGSLLADAPLDATFDGLARLDAVRAPDTATAGAALDTRLVWQPLATPSEPHQVSLQLTDPTAGDGTLWGNGTLELYPAREWQPGEILLSRISVATDPTAIPQAYRLSVGISPTRANAPPAMATWNGARTDRVSVSMVTLTPGSAPLGQALPADMRPVEGTLLLGGGLQLIGARPLPAEVAIGSPLRIGLLWRAVQDAPPTAELTLRLVTSGGQVVQESPLPLLGGRVAPSALHAGNVVRDEQNIVISPRVPSEPVTLELSATDAVGVPAADAPVRLGTLKPTGRAHVFDTSGAQPEATFGPAIQLVQDQVEPGQARANDKINVNLRWRSAAEIQQAYKVFVHLLDPSGQRVVAQRDAEPLDGRAPTTGWLPNELIDDQYTIALPADVPPGDYPLEVGVYDPRSGDRLLLGNGDNRFVLPTRLHVQ
ncbi:MAG TPA: PA14 domain-containing protein [Chloroflexota bacterium]